VRTSGDASEIYEAAADGSGVTKLTNGGGPKRGLCWSPDGTKIAFVMCEAPALQTEAIYVLSLSDRTVNKLSPGFQVVDSICWTPDGGSVIFGGYSGGREIYSIGADGQGLRSLGTKGGVEPILAPDGSRIAYNVEVAGHTQICVMNVDGSDQQILTWEGSNFHQNWSPDSSRIAFTGMRQGPSQIWVMRADGTGETKLTKSGTESYGPVWSPDGTNIAFESNGVVVMNADGKVRRRLPGARNPAWSPDSSRLAFLAYDEGRQTYAIHSVRLPAESPVRIGQGESVAWAPR